MKKLTALFTSAVIAACTMTSFAANAQGQDYSPRLYFKTEKSDEYDVLPSGKIYINTSSTDASKISFNANVFIDDKWNNAGLVFVKWQGSDKGIEISEFLNPVEYAGGSPYAEFEKAEDISWSLNKEENFIGVAYVCMVFDKTLTFKGEKSDSYPLGGFKANVDTSIPAGNYSVNFMNEDTQKCDILYRFEDNSTYEVYPVGNYAKPLPIGISDRMLGDVDNTGKHEAFDASTVLAAYADLSASKDTGLSDAQLVASDVDGDGVITAADASMILSYYTYLNGGGKLSIVDYQAELV